MRSIERWPDDKRIDWNSLFAGQSWSLLLAPCSLLPFSFPQLSYPFCAFLILFVMLAERRDNDDELPASQKASQPARHQKEQRLKLELLLLHPLSGRSGLATTDWDAWWRDVRRIDILCVHLCTVGAIRSPQSPAFTLPSSLSRLCCCSDFQAKVHKLKMLHNCPGRARSIDRQLLANGIFIWALDFSKITYL